VEIKRRLNLPYSLLPEMTMVKFLLIFNFLQVEACLRTSEKKLPNLQTCTRESNFGKKAENDAKIVGGITAENNQWPFITRLTIGFDDGQEALCGGTIIDNNWVLTYDFYRRLSVFI